MLYINTPEENMYPQINSVDTSAPEATELRILSSSGPTTAMAEAQEQQLPLYEDQQTTRTRLPSNGTRVPRKKVKFLRKLLNFCSDPKRREQTCSKRNKTLTLCKDIISRHLNYTGSSIGPILEYIIIN